MPAPVHRRVPYISGGTKNRDHFQFRRYNDFPESNPATYLPPPPYSIPSYLIEADRATMVKWLWRVREWTFSGSVAYQGDHSLVVTEQPSGITHTAGCNIHVSGSWNVTLKPYVKTGPTGIQGYAGIVPTQTESAVETDLLDSFRDSDLFALFTKGCFGWAPDIGLYTPVGGGSAFPAFGEFAMMLDTSSWTVTFDGSPLDLTWVPNEQSRFVSFAALVMRWEPPVPPDNTNPVLNSQLIWDSSNQKIKIPIFIGFNFASTNLMSATPAPGNPYLSTSIDVSGANNPFTDGPNWALTGSGSIGTFNMDGHTLPIYGSIPVLGGSFTASASLTPSRFWAYQNRLGQPVYDETTGAQVNDPFA